MSFFSHLLATLALMVASTSAFAQTRHYMVMFAAEGSPSTARTSHTFATFVREDGGRIVEEKTISWLPQEGYFGPNYTMPPLAIVPGHNYTLDQTMARSPGRRTSFWGPYEISTNFYRAASNRVAYLNRAETSYKMMNLVRGRLRDAPLRNQPGGAINCIMAVSDLAGYIETGTAWGVDASSQVLGYFRPYVLDNMTHGPVVAHPDVAQRMNLYRRIGR